ncbi:MAG: hypothetical protein H7Y41_07630 [Hyphomonadaceae bacterium]|nr:hypothetical protein [Clostridia bacterium]
MMKKALSCIVLAMVFLLAGCANITYHITVQPDQTADLQWEVLVPKTSQFYIENAAYVTEQIKETLEGANNENFKTKPIDDAQYVGFTATKRFSTLEILMQAVPMQITDNSTKNFVFKKGIFMDSYAANLSYTVPKIKIANKPDDYMTPYLNALHLKLLVNVPVKVQSSNQTTVAPDGTLVWDMSATQANHITLKASAWHKKNMAYAGAILFLVICLVVVIVRKPKQSK